MGFIGFIERAASASTARPAMLSAFIVLSAITPARPVGAATPAATSRGACEAALALEQSGQATPTSSRGPCHSAFIVDGAPEDMRNEVASMMSAAHPSLDDLAIATLISEAAIHKAANQPWGYMARCDIARRLGNADAVDSCLADLQRVAPNHPATKQALALATEHAAFGSWVLRILFLLALVATLADALWCRARTTPRSRRSRGSRRSAPPASPKPALLLVVVCSLLSGLGSGVARAEPSAGSDQLSEFKIDGTDPEASVPSVELQNSRPLEFGYYLQDLAAKAEKAAKKGDHASEARYYRALAAAAPTTSFPPRKLCDALEAAGDIPNAIVACRTALTRQASTVGDYLHFVRVVLASKGPLAPGEREELNVVLTHLTSEAQLGALPTMLRCEVALRFGDTPALEACSAELGKTAPNDPKTVSFQWALALRKHDRATALQLVARARGMGVSQDGVARMEQATRQMTWRLIGRCALLALGAALVAALMTLGFRRLAQRRRLAV